MTAPALDWNDPFAVRAWVRDVSSLVKDLVTVAEDQTDPPGERFYGRAGARTLIDEASLGLDEQLAHARRGLLASEGWVQVISVFPEIVNGRRRVSFVGHDGVQPDMFVTVGDLDGDLLRVVILSDPKNDPVAVAFPTGAAGGTRVNVSGHKLFRVRGPET